MKINVARRAELSRYKFVCRWRCREGLVQSNVARRAELLRYKFVCRWPEGATKIGEQREERLAAGRNLAAVKRSNETSEQREERLAAQLQVTTILDKSVGTTALFR